MIDLERTQQLTDIIHNTISYSGLEGAVISTPIFNRLHRILQSSLVYLTFSSNKVKRFEHSIGTMYLSGEILYNSINNTQNDEYIIKIISECAEEIKQWNKDLDYKKAKGIEPGYWDKYSEEKIFNAPLPKNQLYSEYLPKHVTAVNIDPECLKNKFSDTSLSEPRSGLEHLSKYLSTVNKNKFSYLVLFQSVRLAGLLHDIGHLPYSHVFEHATKLLFSTVNALGEKNKAQGSFIDIMKPYYEEDKELHEEIGFKLLDQITDDIIGELSKNPKEEHLFVLAVFHFTKKILKSKLSENTLFGDMHRIISGILDADRLDYCSRDAFCSGLTKDIFPYKKLFSTYRIQLINLGIDSSQDKNNTRQRIMFCPALKTLNLVESLLDKRWEIFSQINYHHRVHKHEIIFSEILSQIGFDELAEINEIPTLETNTHLPLKLSAIWSVIKQLSEGNALIDYHIIQLDDSWMDTLLKQAFFNKYQEDYRNLNKYEKNYTWNMFDELISTKKHYNSRFKRSVNFFEFDEKFKKEWIKNVKRTVQNSLTLKMVNFLNKLKDNKANLFTFNYVISMLNKDAQLIFYKEAESSLNAFLSSEDAKDVNVIRCLIRPCDFSLGCYNVAAPVFFWKNDDSCVALDDVSIKSKQLMLQKNIHVPFHLYYLSANNGNENWDKLDAELIKIMLDILPIN